MRRKLRFFPWDSPTTPRWCQPHVFIPYLTRYNYLISSLKVMPLSGCKVGSPLVLFHLPWPRWRNGSQEYLVLKLHLLLLKQGEQSTPTHFKGSLRGWILNVSFIWELPWLCGSQAPVKNTEISCIRTSADRLVLSYKQPNWLTFEVYYIWRLHWGQYTNKMTHFSFTGTSSQDYVLSNIIRKKGTWWCL